MKTCPSIIKKRIFQAYANEFRKCKFVKNLKQKSCVWYFVMYIFKIEASLLLCLFVCLPFERWFRTLIFLKQWFSALLFIWFLKWWLPWQFGNWLKLNLSIICILCFKQFHKNNKFKIIFVMGPKAL